MNFASAPVEQGDIVLSAVLGLVGESNSFAVVGPVRTLFANGGRVGDVDRLATVGRYGE